LALQPHFADHPAMNRFASPRSIRRWHARLCGLISLALVAGLFLAVSAMSAAAGP